MVRFQYFTLGGGVKGIEAYYWIGKTANIQQPSHHNSMWRDLRKSSVTSTLPRRSRGYFYLSNCRQFLFWHQMCLNNSCLGSGLLPWCRMTLIWGFHFGICYGGIFQTLMPGPRFHCTNIRQLVQPTFSSLALVTESTVMELIWIVLAQTVT